MSTTDALAQLHASAVRYFITADAYFSLKLYRGYQITIADRCGLLLCILKRFKVRIKKCTHVQV